MEGKSEASHHTRTNNLYSIKFNKGGNMQLTLMLRHRRLLAAEREQNQRRHAQLKKTEKRN